MNKNWATCYSICFVILMIVGLSLFGVSFSIIELNNVGILKNKYTISLESDKIYMPGRYFIGLQGTFIVYPINWQYITFSSNSGSDAYYITGKTQAGSAIQLEATLTYRIKYEFLFELFQKYPNQNQKTDMITTAKSAIQNVITKYNNDDFFSQRDTISNEMSTEVNTVFKSKFYCELTMFLLREIKLETQYEQRLIDQLVKKRQAITAVENQTVQLIQGQINVISSNADLQVNELLTQANTTATQTLAKANAEGNAAIIEAEGIAYKDFLNSTHGLNFTEKELMQYFYIKNVMANSQNTVGGFPDSSLFSVKT